jgi:hypothetical protein
LESGGRYFSWRDSFENWVNLVYCITTCEPRFLTRVEFPEGEDAQMLLGLLARELSRMASSRDTAETKDDCEYDISLLKKDIEHLEQLLLVVRKNAIPDELAAVPEKLSRRLLTLEQRAEELDEEDPGEGIVRPVSQPTFSISALFEDL